MNRPLRLGVVISCVLTAGSAQAGAFLFSDSTARPIDTIAHPRTFTGAGGEVVNSVCLNTSVLPTGVSAATVEATLLKAIRTWNRQRPVTRNLRAGGNNDIGSSQIDYESTLLHEMGHCIGLSHPNLASESGLDDPQRNATQARRGADNVFDTDDGADNIFGSADDVRDDDVNRFWFRIDSNDPMAFPSVIDPSTFSVDPSDLPGGQLFAANGDRAVLAALGYVNTESVMQQGQFNDEAQRRITPEDMSTLRIGMAGLDEIQGTADDYTLRLVYGGQVSSNTCDINVTFGTAFASCSFSGTQVGPNANHRVLTSALIEMGRTTNWHFSQTENTAVAAAVDPTSPDTGSTATVEVSVDRLSGVMTGTPGGSFEATVGSSTCTGVLSDSDSDTSTGSCDLLFADPGVQAVTVLYLGDQGFDASETSFEVTVGVQAATATINSDAPDPSVVGQNYNVVVSVSGSAGTPTGTVNVSDGAAGCNITLSSGSGNCTLASATAGNKTLTASYSGDGTYTPDEDTESHQVNRAASTLLIDSITPGSPEVEEPYTVNVTFSVPAAGAAPTGNISVGDGETSCNIPAASLGGSCQLTASSTGMRTVTANYPGNANYLGDSDSQPITVVDTSIFEDGFEDAL